jgi:UDP-N-acetylmuramoyl-tripeptide--D-alanyl-D-alanine ligase
MRHGQSWRPIDQEIDIQSKKFDPLHQIVTGFLFLFLQLSNTDKICMDISKLYDVFLKSQGIAIDSRKVGAGNIFFALHGEHFNGNSFAGKALETGAAFAVIDDDKYLAGEGYILVENVLVTLQQLARYHRDQFDIPVVAITGSNGKTTTKELTSAVLSKKYKTLFTQGNLNNHIGVPLTLLSISHDTAIAVIEMGANHRNEIAQLCRIANPGYGLITNIGKAHLEGFGGIMGVIKAKTELFQHIRENEGKIFINADDDLLAQHAKSISQTTYGANAKADICGKIIEEFPFLSVQLDFGGEIQTIESSLIGSYNFGNILAAACIGHFFGVEPAQIKQAIEDYKPENNRSQFIQTSKNKIVMDAYNANPSSMEAAIKHFSKYPGNKKMLILGDMLELGEEGHDEHRRILEIAKKTACQAIMLVGKIFAEINDDKAIVVYLTTDDALAALYKSPVSGKAILLKGSRGIQLEELLPAL